MLPCNLCSEKKEMSFLLIVLNLNGYFSFHMELFGDEADNFGVAYLSDNKIIFKMMILCPLLPLELVKVVAVTLKSSAIRQKN